MDKVTKFLKRLSTKERRLAQQAIEDTLNHDLSSYDLKKMKGYANLYRVRVGQLRIIFIQNTDDAQILLIDRRNDTNGTTDKDF